MSPGLLCASAPLPGLQAACPGGLLHSGGCRALGDPAPGASASPFRGRRACHAGLLSADRGGQPASCVACGGHAPRLGTVLRLQLRGSIVGTPPSPGGRAGGAQTGGRRGRVAPRGCACALAAEVGQVQRRSGPAWGRSSADGRCLLGGTPPPPGGFNRNEKDFIHINFLKPFQTKTRHYLGKKPKHFE